MKEGRKQQQLRRREKEREMKIEGERK